MLRTVVLGVVLLFSGCADPYNSKLFMADEKIMALIVGSAQSPDPVLARVRELEKLGEVEQVVVLESFPVQIHLRATRATIKELESIPRVHLQH